MTRRELLERIDSRELAEWLAYYEISPFGPERDELRESVTTRIIARGLGVKLPDDPLRLFPAFQSRAESDAGDDVYEEAEAIHRSMMKVAGMFEAAAQQKQKRNANGHHRRNKR